MEDNVNKPVNEGMHDQDGNKPEPGDQDSKKKSKRGVFRKENKEEALQQKLDETNDKYLRLFAEFDNFRKRSLREKADLLNYASEEVISTLLPILDDFDRAMQSVQNAADLAAVKEGMTLIYNKLQTSLEQKGLSPMQCKGETFDTDFHEAITSLATSPEMKGKVVDEVQKGYLYKGKVLRFAKVVVGS